MKVTICPPRVAYGYGYDFNKTPIGMLLDEKTDTMGVNVAATIYDYAGPTLSPWGKFKQKEQD